MLTCSKTDTLYKGKLQHYWACLSEFGCLKIIKSTKIYYSQKKKPSELNRGLFRDECHSVFDSFKIFLALCVDSDLLSLLDEAGDSEELESQDGRRRYEKTPKMDRRCFLGDLPGYADNKAEETVCTLRKVGTNYPSTKRCSYCDLYEESTLSATHFTFAFIDGHMQMLCSVITLC